MATNISEALAQIVQERNISEEAALKIVEDTILAAYKRRFGQMDNAVIRFSNENHTVIIYAKKQVVDGVYDPVTEIELTLAKEMNEDAEEGDFLLIELDPKTFQRAAVQSARQTAVQHIREIRKDSLYAEYKDKEGEIIIGYYQRERNGTIYVDLGKIEGVLPKKFQSPREIYHVNDRIKALIHKVEKTPTGLQVVLSRTHSEFVQAIFELEVPEVYDKTVEIHKIVREPGYRTKLAVYTNKDDVDPVGACVGMKGSRIQTIIRDLEGEKIDVLKWDPDPQVFIANALSPAEVRNIIILDEAQHKALAVVNDSQLSLAIGKQGLNVRLANRLTDWSIDVKTLEQYEESGLFSNAWRAASELFGDSEEDLVISEIEGLDAEVVKILSDNNISTVNEFYALESGELAAFGLNDSQISALNAVLEEYVEFEEKTASEPAAPVVEAAPVAVTPEEPAKEVKVEEPAVSQEAEEDDREETEEYECPHCGGLLTDDMTKCPNCGVEIDWV
ncbi:MAG: transcription termination factor NusA [Spirochaetaceae bacterium]|jgi:N utilization substance protein A|nr:transcription termination factor NusA [Spirochaetaceae bacterium]